VKAQAEFQAKHRLEETKKKREAKRKRDEEVDTALLDDFDLQPPPCKEIKVVSKTALIRERQSVRPASKTTSPRKMS